MTRTLISCGSTFEAQIGFSRAVVAGPWVFVSGTTGFDYANMAISDSVVAQTEQCLKNILSALEQAGATMKDVVRVTMCYRTARSLSRAGRCCSVTSARSGPRP